MEYEVRVTYLGKSTQTNKANKVESLDCFTVSERSKDCCLKRSKLLMLEKGYQVRSANFAIDHSKAPSKSLYIQLVVTDLVTAENNNKISRLRQDLEG